MSDEHGNLMVYQISNSPANHLDDFFEAKKIAEICLSEVVMGWRSGKKECSSELALSNFQTEKMTKKINFDLIGGVHGSLYVLYEIPEHLFRLLDDLEKAVASRESEARQIREMIDEEQEDAIRARISVQQGRE